MKKTAAANETDCRRVAEFIERLNELLSDLVSGTDARVARPPSMRVIDCNSDTIGRLVWTRWHGYGFVAA
jgi:hypothetical protein